MRNRRSLWVVLGIVGSVAASGCAVAGDPGDDVVGKKVPTSTYGDTIGGGTGSGDGLTQPTAAQGSDVQLSFIDLSAVAVRDESGHEFLYQWLLLSDTQSFVGRRCIIDRVGGPRWNECSSWSARHWVSELALGIGNIRSFGAYAYDDARDGVHTQWVAQTAIDAGGTNRYGRACPVEGGAINFESCTSWNRLHFSAADMKLDYMRRMRDDSMVAFPDAAGHVRFVETVMHVDGYKAAERECESPGGDPAVDPSTCRFSPTPVWVGQRYAAPLADYLGHGGFTYHDGDRLIYNEGFITHGGFGGIRRACPVTTSGVDWKSCSEGHEVPLDPSSLGHLPF